MKKNILLIIFSIFLILPSLSYSAIKVTSTRGKVSYSRVGKWSPVRKGMTLKKGTRIMTGLRSFAILNFDGHTITLRSMSKMKIYQNLRSSKQSINRIGLNFGSVNAKIKRIKKLKTVFKISTPVATSSVRGTEEEVSFWKSKGMKIIVIKGSIYGESKHGTLATVSGKQTFKVIPGKVRPDHLLSDQFHQHFINITDPNTTDNEKEGFLIGSADDIDNNDIFLGTPFSDLDDSQVSTSPGSQVDINIIWP